MSDSRSFEDLKRRKEQLLLEQEVARLERRQRFSRAGNWAWWWVAPVAAVGALLLLGGLGNGEPVPVVLGLAGLTPAGLKIYFKR